jgi:hypothetical protein
MVISPRHLDFQQQKSDFPWGYHGISPTMVRGTVICDLVDKWWINQPWFTDFYGCSAADGWNDMKDQENKVRNDSMYCWKIANSSALLWLCLARGCTSM